MKRRILAATDNEALDDLISNLKSDFDYIIDGLETLSRRGAESNKLAMSVATNISADLEKDITAIADAIMK